MDMMAEKQQLPVHCEWKRLVRPWNLGSSLAAGVNSLPVSRLIVTDSPLMTISPGYQLRPRAEPSQSVLGELAERVLLPRSPVFPAALTSINPSRRQETSPVLNSFERQVFLAKAPWCPSLPPARTGALLAFLFLKRTLSVPIFD